MKSSAWSIARRFVPWLCRGFYGVLASLLAMHTAGAHNGGIPESLEQLSLSPIADQVYVVHGMQTLPDTANQGFISNSGIVIGENGVIVIDSGGSRVVGERILVLLEQLTPKPVVAVINSHIHGDHWLGNLAIGEKYPEAQFIAHPRAIERLQAGEAEDWAALIGDMIAPGENSTQILIPDMAAVDGDELEFAGRRLKVHHTGHAHTDGDLMIQLAAERILFTGDIVEYQRAVSSDVPQDFDIDGQIAAIEYALGLPIDIYVPGHGPSGDQRVADGARQFLISLRASVKRYYDEGQLDYEMLEAVRSDMAAYRDWYGMEFLGRLVSHVYQQIEARDFQ